MAETTPSKFIYFPDDNSLIYSGCYYFKLQFAPNYNINTNKLLESFTNDALSKTVAANKINIDNIVKSITESIKSETGQSATAYIQNAVLRSDVAALYGKYKAAAGIQAINEVQNATNEANIGNEYKYEAMYESQNLEGNTHHLFLPLNSMKISRKAGITSQSGIYNSVQQQASAKALKESEEAFEGTLGTITRGSGMTDNPFLGHITGGVDFERFNMEWDLLPKNAKEMSDILQIALYFQTSCLSSLNINDKKSAKWILPPKAEVGILVSNISTTQDEYLKKMIDERVFKEGNDNTPGTGEMKIDSVKTFWLKPPLNVFVDSVSIEPIENRGGVLLSAEGFPMGIKLNVELIRTTLSTVQDLFKADNRDVHSMNDGTYKNGNPFA